MFRKPLTMTAMSLALATLPVAASAQSISAQDRAIGAQANPQLVAEYGGAYTGPQAAFVQRVGQRVAVQSGLSNASKDFTITMLNSPVENAFAIPGGYVYVTRQLVGLMNSSDELAFVLGHEVGHVAARHSTKRNNTSSLGQLLASGLGALTGSNIVSSIANAGAKLYTLGYSRGQEYEADKLGVAYTARSGYNPYAAPDILAGLEADTVLQARIEGRNPNATPGWASTHPNNADRIKRARALAASAARATTADSATQRQDVDYLRMLDGMPYDDDAAQGVVDGQTFRHRDLRLRFTAPTGYTITNGSDAVSVSGNAGQAQMKAAAATSDVGGFVTTQLRSLGANAATPAVAVQPNGIRYAYQTVRASANNRPVDVTLIAYQLPTSTPYFTVVTQAGQGVGAFAPMLASMSSLSASEAAAIRGKRIKIATVGARDTIDTLSRQMAYPDYQRERFLTLNGLTPNSVLRPGTLVKLVVEG
jgi:predicted Zn-dependent protease